LFLLQSSVVNIVKISQWFTSGIQQGWIVLASPKFAAMTGVTGALAEKSAYKHLAAWLTDSRNDYRLALVG